VGSEKLRRPSKLFMAYFGLIAYQWPIPHTTGRNAARLTVLEPSDRRPTDLPTAQQT